MTIIIWGLKYYADLNDAPVTDLLRQANIKTKNHLMAFSDSHWKDCPYTGKITGAYIIFYQGGPIDHGTHVPGTVAQSNAESEYNAACTAGMDLAHFRMLIHEFLNKYPDIVPEESFQLQMGFLFPFLCDNNLRSSLLIMITRSFLLSCM